MSNPLTNAMLRERRGDQLDVGRSSVEDGPKMTREGVVTATLTSLSIVAVVAVAVFMIGLQNPGLAATANLIGAGGVFVTAIFSAIVRKFRNGSFLSTMILAIFEGMMVGGFTFGVGTTMVQGVPLGSLIIQALIATGALFFGAMFLYASGMIRVTSKFRSFVMMAVIGASIGYGINFLITLFTGNNLLLGSGPLPIIIGVVAIVLSSMSLITSFHDSDVMIASAAPERTKWAMASSIMVDVVWMYLEIFRVMALLNRS